MVAEPIREIPQRELRNSIARVLREVENGACIRVTVSGRPVADLVPVSKKRRWVPREVVERIVREHPLDANFKKDIDFVLDQTVDELWRKWE